MSWNLSLQLNNLYAAVRALQATAISNPVAANFRINALTANTTYGIIDCGSISANRTSGQLILTNYAGTPTLTLNANNTSAFAADITVNGITVGRGNNASVSSNTAVGLNALFSTGGSTQHLTALGIGALQSASTTNFTTGLGSGTFPNLTAGSSNIGIGYNAGTNLIDGSLNTYIGNTTAGSTSAQYETVISNGSGAVGGNTGKGNNTTLITGSTAYLPATVVQNTGTSLALGNSTTTGGVSIPYGNLTFGSTGAVIANQIITATNTNSASASVVLTSTSPQYQLNTYGGGVCTYTLPDATTLTKGTVFQINNNSSGGNSVTVNTFGGATLVSGLLVGTITEIVNLTNATSAGTWDTHGFAPSNATWGTGNLTYSGNVTVTGATRKLSVQGTHLWSGAGSLSGNLVLGSSTSGDAITAGGIFNTVVGQGSGLGLTSGNINTLLGYNSGTSMTTGVGNVALGAGAMSGTPHPTIAPTNNTAIGRDCLSANSMSGSQNIGIGFNTGVVTSGNNNTLIGQAVARSLTTGSGNIVIGYDTGNAGAVLTTGSQNIYIGYGANSANGTNTAEIVIGQSQGFGSNTTTFTGACYLVNSFNIRSSNGLVLWNSANNNTWTLNAGGTSGNSFGMTQTGGNNYEIRYLNSSGVFSVTSDRTRKKNIEPIEPILDKFLQLKPSYFHYTVEEDETKDKSLGLIAQEVEEIFKNDTIVSKNNEGIYSLNYGNFTILSIKAIQEQHAKITSLEAQLASLKAVVDALVAQKDILVV